MTIPEAPYWEVSATAAKGYIIINVLSSGRIDVQQECNFGSKLVQKSLQSMLKQGCFGESSAKADDQKLNSDVTQHVAKEEIEEVSMENALVSVTGINNPLQMEPLQQQENIQDIQVEDIEVESTQLHQQSEHNSPLELENKVKDSIMCRIRIKLSETRKESARGVTGSRKPHNPPRSSRRTLRSTAAQPGNVDLCCHFCGQKYKSKKVLNAHVIACGTSELNTLVEPEKFVPKSDDIDSLLGSTQNVAEPAQHEKLADNLDESICGSMSRVLEDAEDKEKNDPDQMDLLIVPSDEGGENADTTMTNFMCHICGKCFKRKRARNDHVDRHSEERKHPCNKCDKSFKTRGCLYKHMEVHGVTKNFHCKKCARSFKSKGALRRHGANCGKEEPSEKLFKCNQCDSIFPSKNNLASHKRSMHVQFMPCPVCGKYFKAEHRLKVHMVTMHGEQGKFSCKICGKQFIFKSDCLRHEEIHNAENLYLCTHCGKSFKTKDYLSGHIQMHKNLSFPCSQCAKNFKTKKMLRSHMIVHSVIRNYHCTLCGKSFKSSMVLSRHKEVHLNIKRYQCHMCGKAYNNSGSLVHHKKTHLAPSLY